MDNEFLIQYLAYYKFVLYGSVNLRWNRMNSSISIPFRGQCNIPRVVIQ